MGLKTRLSSLLLAALSASFSSPAQVASTPPPPADAQMTLHVTVDTRAGEPVGDLTAADFTLLDNKKEQPITGFHALANTPAMVVVVLDAVNLPYTEVSFARQELSRFFAANGGKLAQPTTLGVLLDSGMQIQPAFTTDGNALRNSLDHFTIGLRELPQSTGVYGADERMQLSVGMLKALVAQLPKQGIKRVIWISPGWPLLSSPEVEPNPSRRAAVFNDIVELSTELQRRQITIDAVNPLGASQDVGRTDYYQNFLRGVRNSGELELGDLGLQVLAVHSGGLVLNGSNNIAGLIQRAIDQTKASYELSFVPAPGERANEYHDLQLKVKRPGLTAHTTTGYYAQPAYAPLERPGLTPPSH